MNQLLAQGDLLFERVDDILPSGQRIPPGPDGATTIAEGEATGHRHVIIDTIVMFRDDGLARDIPGDLYIGHVKVTGSTALVQHDEHSSLPLTPGTWRIRRQRELELRDVRTVQD